MYKNRKCTLFSAAISAPLLFGLVTQVSADTVNASKTNFVLEMACARGEPEESIKACSTIIDASVSTDSIRSTTAEFFRGISNAKLGKLEQAISDFSEVIRLMPNSAPAFNNRANANSLLGRHDEAIADYTSALALDPYHAEAFANRAREYALFARYEMAIADLNKATSINPTLARAFYDRGVIESQLGNVEQAQSDFRRAIDVDPSYELAKKALDTLALNQ